jgi:hypothetical protein
MDTLRCSLGRPTGPTKPSAREEFRRNPGQGLWQESPRRTKPKGASSVQRAKHSLDRKGLSEGPKPRNRDPSGRPGVFGRRGIPLGETVGGFTRAETPGYLPRGESSEGQIPGAPPALNRAGTAPKGENRREGTQTLRTERSGQALARGWWTFDASCAVGNQSP